MEHFRDVWYLLQDSSRHEYGKYILIFTITGFDPPLPLDLCFYLEILLGSNPAIAYIIQTIQVNMLNLIYWVSVSSDLTNNKSLWQAFKGHTLTQLPFKMDCVLFACLVSSGLHADCMLFPWLLFISLRCSVITLDCAKQACNDCNPNYILPSRFLLMSLYTIGFSCLSLSSHLFDRTGLNKIGLELGVRVRVKYSPTLTLGISYWLVVSGDPFELGHFHSSQAAPLGSRLNYLDNDGLPWNLLLCWFTHFSSSGTMTLTSVVSGVKATNLNND